MAAATVVARFTADISDVQAKMATMQADLAAMGAATQTAGAKFAAAGSAMASAGKTMTMGVTLPIVAVGAAAVAAGASFETSMNKVRAVSGATGAQFTAMSDQAKELGRTTQYSASQAADGMSFLAMAGFKANDIVESMPGVLNLAAAGQMDLATAADIASNVLTGYGMSASEMGHAVDVMAKTFTSANTDLTQLGEAMKYAAPVAAGAGIAFEEAAAAIGLMGNAGIQGSMAGTSLRGAITKLLNPADSAAATMERLGLRATDSGGNLLSLEEIVTQLAGSAITTGDYMEIFGQRAGPAMMALVNQGVGALQDLTSELETSGGTAQSIADIQMEGFNGAMLRLKSAFEGAMISIAESGVLDFLTATLEKASGALSAFTGFWEKVPGPIKNVTMVVAGVAAALGPLLWVGGKVMTMLASMSGAWVALNAKIKLATRGIVVSVRSMEMQIKTAMIGAQTRMGALGAGAKVMGAGVVTQFRKIGTAAKGLVASFGPVGIALVGLTVAYEMFAGKQADTEAKVDSLTEAMKEQQGVMGAATVQQLTQAFLDLEYAGANAGQTITGDLAALGVTVDDVVVATLEGKDAWTALTRQMMETSTGNKELESAFARVNGAMRNNYQRVEEAKKNYDIYKTSVEVADRVTQSMGGTVDGVTTDFQEMTPAVEDTRTEIQKISDMFTEFDANVAAIRAKDAARQYMREIDDKLHDTSTALTDNSKAAETNRDAWLGALDAKKRKLLTWAEATGATTDEVDAKWKNMVANLAKQMDTKGFSQSDIEEFLGKDYVDAASVSVAAEMERGISTVSDRVGTAAYRDFKGAGRQMANGLIAGITGGIPPMERAARDAAAAATRATESELGVESPSKVFMRIGADTMEGFRLGIQQNADGVIEMSATMSRAAVRAWIDGIKEGGPEAREEALKTFKQNFVNAYKETLAALKVKVTEAKQVYNDFAAAVSGGVMGGMDIGAAYDSMISKQKAEADALAELNKAAIDPETSAERLAELQAVYQNAAAAAAEGGNTILFNFNEQAEQTKLFTERMKTLLVMGLDKALWMQVFQQGAEKGILIADHLIAGGQDTIDKSNEILQSVQDTADEIGEDAAGVWYQAGIDDAEKMKKAFVDKFGPDGSGRKRLLRLMDNLAKSMNRTATITVTTVHRTEYESSGLPGRAVGGPVSARQAYIVGERGPEVFVPGFNGNIIPNHEIGAVPSMSASVPVGGSSGGTTVNINVNAGMGADGAEVGRQVVEAIRKYERRSGPVFASA